MQTLFTFQQNKIVNHDIYYELALFLVALNCVILIQNHELTIFPLTSCRMDEAKQFISVYCLWIEVIPNWFPLQVYVGFMENSQYLLKNKYLTFENYFTKSWRVFIFSMHETLTWLFPAPAVPITKTEWRTAMSSTNCITWQNEISFHIFSNFFILF